MSVIENPPEARCRDCGAEVELDAVFTKMIPEEGKVVVEDTGSGGLHLVVPQACKACGGSRVAVSNVLDAEGFKQVARRLKALGPS